MAIIRFADRPFFGSQWADFDRMRREMDLWRGFMDERSYEPGARVYPALNISEDNDNIYVRAEVPGVAPEGLDITIEGDSLMIKGERRPCKLEGKYSYHRREIDCGHFSRAVTLPSKVQADKVGAATAQGILTITLPKAEDVKPKRIEVKVA